MSHPGQPPEFGQEELIGQQFPGDSVNAERTVSDSGGAADHRVPEIAQEELVGRQFPGDAVQAGGDEKP